MGNQFSLSGFEKNIQKDLFGIKGFFSIKLYDESNNLKGDYSCNNTITTSFKSLVASALAGSYTSSIKPQNIAFFPNQANANSLTSGTTNLSGITASINNVISLSSTPYGSYGVKYSISHKNPATGSTQRLVSINIGRNWNTTYSQWNTIFAYIGIDKLNVPIDQLNEGAVLLYPKERFTIDWVFDLIPDPQTIFTDSEDTDPTGGNGNTDDNAKKENDITIPDIIGGTKWKQFGQFLKKTAQ